jgi:putative DNA primase/helicase
MNALYVAHRGGHTKEWTRKTGVADWASFLDWLDVERPADRKDCGAFITGELAEDPETGKPRRLNVNVLSRWALLLDADHADAGFQDVLADVLGLLGVAYVAYSTYNHRVVDESHDGAYRYRLVIPLDREVSFFEYETLAKVVIASIGAAYFDKSTHEAGRLMLRPSASDRELYEWAQNDGDPLDVAGWLSGVEVVRRDLETSHATSVEVQEFIEEHAKPAHRDGCVGKEELDRWLGELKEAEERNPTAYKKGRDVAKRVRAGCLGSWALDQVGELLESRRPAGERPGEWAEMLPRVVTVDAEPCHECGAVVAFAEPLPPAVAGEAVAEPEGSVLTEVAQIPAWDSMDALHRGQARMAYRIAKKYGGSMMHVHGVGWFTWTGTHWAEDQAGFATRAVLSVVRDAKREGFDLAKQAVGASEDRAGRLEAASKALLEDAGKCESANAKAGVLELARALKPMAAVVADLDADPYLLNTPAGTLDLHTLEVREHRPADRITKLTVGSYHAGEAGSGWRPFLEQVLPEAPVREFLQRLAGLGLVGKVLEHTLPILTGEGSNGKGVFYGALGHALGDYAIVAEPDLLLSRDGGSAGQASGQMDLMGKRWAVVSESDKNRQLAEATMKRLTGGDKIKAKRMRQDWVEFEPSHLAVLVTNHLPRVSGDDPAVWRRLRVVPFDVVIAPGQADVHLPDRLQLEADAVLTWAVEGWQAYAALGRLDEPEAVLARTASYRADSDVMTQFIDECCEVAGDVASETAPLYETWVRWAKTNRVDPVSQKAFGQQLDRRGYPAKAARRDGSVKRVRKGIRVLTSTDFDPIS